MIIPTVAGFRLLVVVILPAYDSVGLQSQRCQPVMLKFRRYSMPHKVVAGCDLVGYNAQITTYAVPMSTYITEI